VWIHSCSILNLFIGQIALNFIDNKVEYIEKAKSYGINGIVYEKSLDLRKELKEMDFEILS